MQFPILLLLKDPSICELNWIRSERMDILKVLTLVHPKPRKGMMSGVIDLIEKTMLPIIHRRPSHPNHFLSDYCHAPVNAETPPFGDLSIKGSLPECLNGEFFQIGPNPKFSPLAEYSWFDGDGMIHGLRIKDGKASYVSRYVNTSRLKQEEHFGRTKFTKLGDLKGWPGLFVLLLEHLNVKLNVLDFSYGIGTANTSLVYHHGMLLAICEADKPYAVKVMENGDVETLGILDYDKRLTHPFTAHPKVDPVTNEMFTFGCSLLPPSVVYRVINKDGEMLDPVPITTSNHGIMHDFSITERYAIFMDLPTIFDPKKLAKGEFVISFDTTKKARFGVLPRYAKDEHQMKWFELPNCFIFHNANSWEEGDEVVLVTCRLANFDLEFFNGTSTNDLPEVLPELYEMRFNMKTGTASQKKLSAASGLDFPVINREWTGRKQRFVYTKKFGKVKDTIYKLDLEAEPDVTESNLEIGGNVQGIFQLGPGRFCSEPVYVPRQIFNSEDDGYLIFFVIDQNTTGKSELIVIDAKTMSPHPVAVVEIPMRIPKGFHAFFITEDQIQQQLL